ncbi:acyl-CoA thioesterase [Labilibaculum antarcticum]|uniref:4-hydroxybenzoyl-CoA thioesterase n=1 Tax=Labilibaculum antarcticum TaxID=1717717 RepID=A0A1Y1CQB0_9BACT|nr:thioesterase family protein [Labilibaculum antarcticum]BAX82460.1 4-hydroxybenzoyl-CoA thioesterase [Labilibaculum antarcticum]
MSLVVRKTIDIRFSEVDSMRVVWHGSYVKFLEDGRECFGDKFGLGYLDVAAQGLLIPIVDMKLSYKKSAKYGDKLVVETRFISSLAAKLIFEYTIYRKADMAVLVKAQTTQVFTDKEGQLLLCCPDFYIDWKSSVGILK